MLTREQKEINNEMRENLDDVKRLEQKLCAYEDKIKVLTEVIDEQRN